MSRLLDDYEDEQNNFAHWVDENFWAFAGVIFLSLTLLIVAVFSLREYCWRKYGIEVCPGAAGSLRRHEERMQQAADEALARQLQSEMQEELRLGAIVRQRKDRREKYEKYLEHCTLVVSQDDFCRCFDEWFYFDRPERDIETGGADGEENDESQSQTKLSSPTNEGKIILTLPESADGRRVENACAICLAEYEVGEKVTWSRQDDCRHCFHSSCILTWLSRGKKRCPVCRHFFVPGVAIDGLKLGDLDEELNGTGSAREDLEAPGEESEDTIIENLRATRRSSHHAEEGSDAMMSTSPESPGSSSHLSRELREESPIVAVEAA